MNTAYRNFVTQPDGASGASNRPVAATFVTWMLSFFFSQASLDYTADASSVGIALALASLASLAVYVYCITWMARESGGRSHHRLYLIMFLFLLQASLVACALLENLSNSVVNGAENVTYGTFLLQLMLFSGISRVVFFGISLPVFSLAVWLSLPLKRAALDAVKFAMDRVARRRMSITLAGFVILVCILAMCAFAHKSILDSQTVLSAFRKVPYDLGAFQLQYGAIAVFLATLFATHVAPLLVKLLDTMCTATSGVGSES